MQSDGTCVTAAVWPLAKDPGPWPLVENVMAAQHDPSRIDKPHVRRGWLDIGPGARGRGLTSTSRCLDRRWCGCSVTSCGASMPSTARLRSSGLVRMVQCRALPPRPEPSAPLPQLPWGGYGYSVNNYSFGGILMVHTDLPQPVGDLGHARTFPFPVRYGIAHGARPDDMVAVELGGVAAGLVKAAKKQAGARGLRYCDQLRSAGTRSKASDQGAQCPGNEVQPAARQPDPVLLPADAELAILTIDSWSLLDGGHFAGSD